jgi:DUF971 family protein
VEPGQNDVVPKAIRREGDHLVIEWPDGLVGRLTWKQVRDACPCAGCREEQNKPPDPFRLLKSNELVPLAPVSMPRVGRYAYKIVWSDGHDTGIYTIQHLRELSLRGQGPGVRGQEESASPPPAPLP